MIFLGISYISVHFLFLSCRICDCCSSQVFEGFWKHLLWGTFKMEFEHLLFKREADEGKEVWKLGIFFVQTNFQYYLIIGKWWSCWQNQRCWSQNRRRVQQGRRFGGEKDPHETMVNVCSAIRLPMCKLSTFFCQLASLRNCVNGSNLPESF